MPRVPVLDQQVGTQAQTYSTPSVARPVEGAFGDQMSQAASRAGAAVEQFGSTMEDHIFERQQTLNEQQVIAASTQAKRDLQDMLYGTTKDADGNPVPGFLTRQLTSAQGATQQFDQSFQDLKQKYIDQMANPLQKATLSKLLEQSYDSNRSQVISHEATQGQAAYKATIDDATKQSIASAGTLSDPDQMRTAIGQAQTIQGAGLSRMGHDSSSVTLNNQQLAGDMLGSAFKPLLEQDPNRAQALFDGVKDMIPENLKAQFSAQLDQKREADQALGYWNKVQDYQLADGTPDTERMRNDLYDRTDLTTEKKDKIWTYVKDRANEYNRQLNQQSAADDYAFTNQVMGLKQQGGTMDDAMKLAQQQSQDPADQSYWQNMVRTLYTQNTKTDPDAYVTLYEGVKDGKMGKTELGQAYAQGKLSGTDYRNLMKDRYDTLHKDDTFQTKETIDHIKDIAHAQFGTSASGQKQTAEFMYSVMTNARGKSPEETLTIANTLLKSDPKSGWFFKDPNYVTDIKNRDAQNQAWGQLHSDIGRDQVRAIGQGVLFGGKNSWGTADVNSFAQAMGGPDKIKQGTPANAAIQSLIRKGKVVTPDTVRKVLSVHPDGVWQ